MVQQQTMGHNVAHNLLKKEVHHCNDPNWMYQHITINWDYLKEWWFEYQLHIYKHEETTQTQSIYICMYMCVCVYKHSNTIQSQLNIISLYKIITQTWVGVYEYPSKWKRCIMLKSIIISAALKTSRVKGYDPNVLWTSNRQFFSRNFSYSVVDSSYF
jgi:hypothetical protein